MKLNQKRFVLFCVLFLASLLFVQCIQTNGATMTDTYQIANCTVYAPSGTVDTMLFAIQWYNDTPKNHARYYLDAVSTRGLLLALPGSSQYLSGGDQIWNNTVLAMKEIKEQFDAVIAKTKISPSNVIIAGSSQGAGVMLSMISSGLLPCRGFIAVIPFLPESPDKFFSGSYGQVMSQFSGNKSLPAKAVVVSGPGDKVGYQTAKKLAPFLSSVGIDCQLWEAAGDHEGIMSNFSKTLLGKALDFILSGK